MSTMATAREIVSRHFANITEIDEQVIRGEKRYGDRCYAVAYVDFADDIIERANHLEEFQERVMGDDFFGAPEQLRWNNYLYIVAGSKSVAQDGFTVAKARIEADKEYARKRVVSEDELESLLGDSKLFDTEKLAVSKDVVADWSSRLTNAGLDALLDKPTPRTEVVERIGKKDAARASSPAKAKALSALDEQLSKAHLRSLEITRFRPVHDGKAYTFGSVTLIVGPNGSGKTSLLEAIEHLYCGFNRRLGEISGQKIKGIFANLETSTAFDIMATSDTGRIKARCLAWYRRDERLAKQIVEGFTRYNFLDTDAAFRLSTELEPGDISKDLSRLLIGAEASTLWEYLGKISSDLENAWSKSDERLADERKRAALIEVEHKRLQQLPSQGNTLSAMYRAALPTIGWIGAGSGAGSTTERERIPLNAAMQHLNVLLATDAPGSTTKRGVESRVTAIAGALGRASDFHSQLQAEEQQTKKALADSNKLKVQVGVLNRWLEYCTASFSTALAAKGAAQVAVESTGAILGRFVTGNIPTVKNEFANVPLDVAEASAHELASSTTASIATLEASIKGFGQLEAARAHAAQQLKDAAILLLQHGHSARECPVCGTDHTPEALLSKIEAITAKVTSSTELRDVNQSLEASRTSLAGAQQRLRELSTLRQAAQQLRVSVSTATGEIVERLNVARGEAEGAALRLKTTQETLAALARNGLTEREYVDLRSRASAFLEGVGDIDAVAVVTSLRDSKESLGRKAETELIALRTRMENASAEIALIVDELDSPSWPQPSEQKRDFNALLEMRAHVALLSSHLKSLTGYVQIGDDVSFVELRQSLLGVTTALDEALHAIASEAGASEALRTIGRDLNDSKLLIGNLLERTGAQKAALDALKLLIKESSLEDATQEALHTIAYQINDVFGRIHAPREYEYNGDGNNLLRTRESHERRTLEQVSTGQRAAFALSIFLALNLTARSAPPVLLIDDPIAHIDDLNALSFMDYLRDLAVRSKRQIFFATADSRVAALFEKKFAFLGSNEFKTIRLARRAEA